VLGGFALCTLIGLFYFVGFHAMRGQTLGQTLLGVEIITRVGQRPSVLRSLSRAAAAILSAVCASLGFIWIAFDREKRGLHDWLAGTYVVRTR
jgi:uncharacterized RDD family membrane protein YckC